MPKVEYNIQKVRASRAGHTFHERWAARRALQLVFPKDNLFAIAVEGLSTTENSNPGEAADDIADLVLYFGHGDNFETCNSINTIQFKYRTDGKKATSSYLKKTLQKFADTVKGYEKSYSFAEIEDKLSFSFITNCPFTSDLWAAILHLQGGRKPTTKSSLMQLDYLRKWCEERNISPKKLFSLTSFQDCTQDIISQNTNLQHTLCSWSAGADYQSKARLHALTELVVRKAGPEGQANNLIRREDVLDALGCETEDLFPAETRFIDVGEVVKRPAVHELETLIEENNSPIFINAEGGVGKTVFIQSLAIELSGKYEIVVFDCFGGGSYRSENQGRHLPKIGLVQIINELASRGLCDPLLPSDSDSIGLIKAARKRLSQANETIQKQSSKIGLIIILDAADNAQIQATDRNEDAFPRLLLSSLSDGPIEGVNLLLTARPHRMENVIGKNVAEIFELKPFTANETQIFLNSRLENVSRTDVSRAYARSRGNARVLEYLVENWYDEITTNTSKSPIYVEKLIENKCNYIFKDLFIKGWDKYEVENFFSAISLLPPPIPANELANSLGWQLSQVKSAISDLAPMLEMVAHGAIFRDEPTETYIRETYAQNTRSQQVIAERLYNSQNKSMYAAQALPRFLEVIDDMDRAISLAESEVYPDQIQSEYGRRRLKLARLHGAFSMATRKSDFDLLLKLSMQLAQVATANSRGDDFIRRDPHLAAVLGDSDTIRRLFSDRSGWHGARHSRLTIAYIFKKEFDEAEVHSQRARSWLNWHHRKIDNQSFPRRDGPKDEDYVSVVFFDIISGNISNADRILSNWNIRFSQRIANKVISLALQYEHFTDSSVLEYILDYVTKKQCSSVSLQTAVLVLLQGSQNRKDIKRLARATSSTSKNCSEEISYENNLNKRSLEEDFAHASFSAIIHNSKNSSKNILNAFEHKRPSSHQYGETGMSNIWTPVLSSCLSAWVKKEKISYFHLIPQNAHLKRKRDQLKNKQAAHDVLGKIKIFHRNGKKDKKGNIIPENQFDYGECKKISSGMDMVLSLARPIEDIVFRDTGIVTNDIQEFIKNWKLLTKDVHWRSEVATDNICRHIGFNFLLLLIQHSESIKLEDAKEILKLTSKPRYTIANNIALLHLLCQHENLKDLCGSLALKISKRICQDEYVEERGQNFADLSSVVLNLDVSESREYYKEGLVQLDKLGGNDFDLLDSLLQFASSQSGGHLQPHLSQRLMNLVQIIAQHEPGKFGWTLFSSAAVKSIGLPAAYKFLRWADQDVADYSYNLPQFVCFAAKGNQLSSKRAAAILCICEDHGWHEWQTGRGLEDILKTAATKDRRLIADSVIKKLKVEYYKGGYNSLWQGILSTLELYPNLTNSTEMKAIESRRKIALQKRDEDNRRSNYTSLPFVAAIKTAREIDEKAATECEFNSLVKNCDLCSSSSIDETIIILKKNKRFEYWAKEKFMDALVARCPVKDRLGFARAMCKIQNLRFNDASERVIENIKIWSKSSLYFSKNRNEFVKLLFDFKGSSLFEPRYIGIANQVGTLISFCNDSEFVLQQVVNTVAREHLELTGNDWLGLSNCLCKIAAPSTGLTALEDLLSGPFANIADEIGEGIYKQEFKAPTSETEFVTDIFWHLLGNIDTFVRWNTARAILTLTELELFDEIESLLDRIGSNKNPRLISKQIEHSSLNATQWLFIGLARATHYQPQKLKFLTPKLNKLFDSNNLHIINKILLTRCLKNLHAQSVEIDKTMTELLTPPMGCIEANDRPPFEKPKLNFRFDYDFEKNEISNLASLFNISKGEASDSISNEILKDWPDASDMNYFTGEYAYPRGTDEKTESYREHIQRHALLLAATKLSLKYPVIRSSYDSEDSTPWANWIDKYDLGFKNGSWLSDHKNPLPKCTGEFLLNSKKSKNNNEMLYDLKELLTKLGLKTSNTNGLIPIYANWKSPDGVSVRITSALTNSSGAIRRCKEMSSLPNHELWLPVMDQTESLRNHHKIEGISPWIIVPEHYPIGIDNGDEYSALGARNRPQIGAKFTTNLSFLQNNEGTTWLNPKGEVILRSIIWGGWENNRDGWGQNDGEILLANPEWIRTYFSGTKQSLIYYIKLIKRKSRDSYEDNENIRKVIIGLQTKNSELRFWNAKNSTNTHF